MPDFDTVLPGCYINGVGPLPVSAARSSGGQSGAIHKSYGKRGADIEPTGLDEYSGTLTLELYNNLYGYPDNIWPNLYYDLLNALEDNPLATLTHPTKGQFRALLRWDEVVDPEKRNGVTLEISWQEHNAEAGKLLAEETGVEPVSAEDAAIKAEAADAAAQSISSTYQPIAPTIKSKLQDLDTDKLSAAKVQGNFTDMYSTIDVALNDPGLSGANANDAIIAIENTRASLVKLQSRYLSNDKQQRSYTVPDDMALWEIARDVYGDATKTAALLSANAIDDVLLVKAGTSLKVPQ